MSALAQLTYVSRRSATTAQEDARADVGDILGVARAANAEHGITGALLSNAHCFAQVLEGSTEAVERLFGRIRVDPRHDDVVLLGSRPLQDRRFPDWSMGFTGSSTVDEVESAAYLLERAFAAAEHGPAPGAADAVANLIQARVSRAQIW